VQIGHVGEEEEEEEEEEGECVCVCVTAAGELKNLLVAWELEMEHSLHS